MSKEILIAEFEKIYLNDPDFAESILYTTNSISKTIKAVIYRKGYLQQRQVGDRSAGSMQSVYDVELAISRGVINGIEFVIEKSDSVEIPVDYGDSTLVKMRVSTIIKQDIACWRLGLTK